MIETERCRCGARIVHSTHIDMKDGKDTYIYTCGICGSEIKFRVVSDPQRL